MGSVLIAGQVLVADTVRFTPDTFLYTFIVPILPYMIEVRIGLDPDYTQRMSFALLSQGAFISVIISPLIDHYADKSSTKRVWLLSSLVVCLVGTFVLAVSMSGRFGEKTKGETVTDGISGGHLHWTICSGAGQHRYVGGRILNDRG